jgi:hypothetical protein
MKHKLLGIILLAVLLISSRPISAAQKQPLTERDVIALLRGGVYSSRIAALVEDRGITFDATPGFLRLLRRAGAQKSLEHAVAVAPRIIPKVKLSVQKPPSGSGNVPVATSDNKLSGTYEGVALPEKQPNSPSQEELEPTRSQLSVKSEDTIPVGTKIDMGNWGAYRQYMPLGMVELFEGNHFWRMPLDIEIDVGPTVIYSLPRGYDEATRKYSDDVRVVHLANGHNNIENYRGGMPFPDPQEPDKGYKLLTDLWFAYVPHMIAGTARNPSPSG